MTGSGFARNVVILTGGTILGRAIILASSPVLTRLYAPEEFGVLAVYISLLVPLVTVASLRYNTAIPLPKEDETAANLLVLSLMILAGMTLFSALGVWLMGEPLAGWANSPALGPYLWLLPLSLLGAGGYRVFNDWAVRRKAFSRIARTRLNQSLSMALSQVGLGLAGLGQLGLLIGDVAGRAGGGGSLAMLALRKDREKIKRVSCQGMRMAAGRYRRFPLISSWSSFINTLGLQLPALLFAAFYGTQVAGWFALGLRVIGIPMNVVGEAVGQVYIGEAARLIHEDPKELIRLFRNVTGSLLRRGIIPIVILGMAGPWFFRVAFGKGWDEAGVYMQILAVMFIVQFTVVPLSQTLNLVERQDLQLVWDVGRLVLVPGGLVLAGYLGLSARTAMIIYGATMCFAYAVLYILTLVTLKNRE